VLPSQASLWRRMGGWEAAIIGIFGRYRCISGFAGPMSASHLLALVLALSRPVPLGDEGAQHPHTVAVRHVHPTCAVHQFCRLPRWMMMKRMFAGY
jgi:hypothetical protein